jgi:hypothetical protein
MVEKKNFVGRVFDALVAGRERQAREYIARFDAEYRQTTTSATKK